MSETLQEKVTYDQDIVIIWQNRIYHIPATEWQMRPSWPINANHQVDELVRCGAALASIPDYENSEAGSQPGGSNARESNTPKDLSPNNFAGTCFLLNIDVIKGG
ncbi:hypothetical protein [Roseibium sp. RKSG952]|uniref:hypothetical protein n=1 Tax=Roseibium sp. RKSG952 TaxID=2529384 RepID=UPI0012BCFCDA|nr:hypothetical protein [Roseibium sp. RKSG952]MTH97502.1 hypothetical protein [Roseibium sp. RKSG952]